MSKSRRQCRPESFRNRLAEWLRVGVEQELNRRLTTACGVYTEVVGYSPSSVSGAIRRNRSWFSRNALLVRAWPVASVSNA